MIRLMFYLATDARKDRSEGYQCNTRCKSGTSDEAGVVVTVVGARSGGVAGAGGCIAGAGELKPTEVGGCHVD